MSDVSDIELHAIYFLSGPYPLGFGLDQMVDELDEQRSNPYHELHEWESCRLIHTREDIFRALIKLIDIGLMRILEANEIVEWSVIEDIGIKGMSIPRDRRVAGDVILTQDGWHTALSYRYRCPRDSFGRLWQLEDELGQFEIAICSIENEAQNCWRDIGFGTVVEFPDGRHIKDVGRWRPSMYEYVDRGYLTIVRLSPDE